MNPSPPVPSACDEKTSGLISSGVQIQALAPQPAKADIPCCGPPPAPPSSPDEKPGYRIQHFVEKFQNMATGGIPVVRSRPTGIDRIGTLKTRLGFGRDRYTIAPGLYAVGNAGRQSPVLVTANYKLTFDQLRGTLSETSAWILVLDTRGVNVWCAAGKGTFSTEEVVRRVKATQLEAIVEHRQLILPQLSATGVSALKIRKLSGFEVVWGPIRAQDIPRFLKAGHRADEAMRQVSFSLWERLILIPVEIHLALKPALWILLAVFLLSGIGPGVFSISLAWSRGGAAAASLLAGLAAGGALTPALLPWLPGRAFALKGLIAGLPMGLLTAALYNTGPGAFSFLSLALFSTTISSFLAMNFTGSTPFTSPTGVEKEMRRAIPFQALGALTAAILWVIAAFQA